MPHRYKYPGTEVLKNRFGTRDPNTLMSMEAAVSARQRTADVPDFSADMDGLKRVHAVLFDRLYEWAGRTRGEAVTISGETFTPEDHILSKGDTQFAPASVSVSGLPRELERQRNLIDTVRARGELDLKKWAEATADQIGAINHAHPFREGNGRAMRRFIELSGQVYGYQVRVAGGPEWVKASHEAMDEKKTGLLAKYIQQSQIDRRPPGLVSENLGKYLAAADQAVGNMTDPDKRKQAQKLLSAMKRRPRDAAYEQNQQKGADNDYDIGR